MWGGSDTWKGATQWEEQRIYSHRTASLAGQGLGIQVRGLVSGWMKHRRMPTSSCFKASKALLIRFRVLQNLGALQLLQSVLIPHPAGVQNWCSATSANQGPGVKETGIESTGDPPTDAPAALVVNKAHSALPVGEARWPYSLPTVCHYRPSSTSDKKMIKHQLCPH